MRYDTKHKEQTRARVLGEAAKAIRAEGPDRIGVAAIMARAGLTHGGFYAHFASKDELIAAALDEMFTDSLVNFKRITAGLAPEQALAAYLAFYLSDRHRRARDVGCPLAALSADMPRLPEAARNRFAVGTEHLTAAIAGLLRAMGRPEPEALASSAFAEMVGALSIARALPDGTEADAMLARSRGALARRLGIALPSH